MTKKQAMPYMKFYTSYLDDLDLNKLAESTRWRYLQIYILAFKADKNGLLVDPETGAALTVEDIAFLIRANKSTVKNDLEKLTASGLLQQDQDAWIISRYSEEQINQADFRKAAAERKAKERSKEKEVKESEEKEIENNSSSNQSKDKRHNNVTRDTDVTNENLSDDDDENSMISYFAYLVGSYEEVTGLSATSPIKKVVQDALDKKVDPSEIYEKISQLPERKPENPEAYFLTCIKGLLP